MSFEMMAVLSVEDGLRTDCRRDWEYQGQEGGYCNNPGEGYRQGL